MFAWQIIPVGERLIDVRSLKVNMLLGIVHGAEEPNLQLSVIELELINTKALYIAASL